MRSRNQPTGTLVSSLALACAPLLLFFSALAVVPAEAAWYGSEPHHIRGGSPGGSPAAAAPRHWNPAFGGQAQPVPPPPPAQNVFIVNEAGSGEQPAPRAPSTTPVTVVMEEYDSEKRKLPGVRGVKRTILGAWLASAGLPLLGALSLTYGVLRLAGSLYDRHHVHKVNEARAGERLLRRLVREQGGRTGGSH